MNVTPLVSLLIPVFNRLPFLPDLIRSLKEQTYENWEAVFVDDGSADGSFDYLQEAALADERIRVFKRPSSYLPGGNAARNYAFSKSKGEYVNFIDSDDVVLPVFIESKLQVFRANNDSEGVVGKTHLVEFDLSRPRIDERTQQSLHSLDAYIQFKYKLYMHDVMWRKSFLASISRQLFDPKLRKGQDFDFHLRVLTHNPRLGFTDVVGYFYRYNPQSISSNYSSDLAESMLDSQYDWMKSPLLKTIAPASWESLFLYQLKALSFVTSELSYFHRVAAQLIKKRNQLPHFWKLISLWFYEYARGIKRILLRM